MIATARELAKAHPEGKFPCPVCANTLKAENLDKHLGKVHPGATDPASPWRGKDYRIIVTALFLIPVGVAIGAAIVAATPVSAESLTGFRIIAGCSGPFLLLALVGLTGIFRGSVAIAGDRVRLRHSFLLRRTVKLPCAVEAGGLWGGRSDGVLPASEYNQPSTPIQIGNYVRLHGDGGSIIVVCRTSTQLREHWTGWTQGPKRHVCHLVVDRQAMVALEYALAKRGVLRA